nr:helix-turn-helix domain-containing protein [Bacteroides uniformis]
MKTALSISKGNLTQAAALLGISRPTLYKRMSLHGISR